MRVISWNLGYMKPAHYKTYAIRERQWSALMALGPDVALLQECRPTDLAKFLPPWAAEHYVVVGEKPDRWIACSTILARRSLSPTLVADEDPWCDLLSGYLVRAVITHHELGEVHLASVHAIAEEVDDPTVSRADHDRIRRPGCENAWYNDLAADALRRGWATRSS
jgi:hypothetical protein